MSLIDNYVDGDVVKHFASLIADSTIRPVTIAMFGAELWSVFKKYDLISLLPGLVSVVNESGVGLCDPEKLLIDRMVAFSMIENAIVTVKEKYLAMQGTKSTLQQRLDAGADIRVVDDILGAMVVASRKRRNKVVYAVSGYEDEGLITAAGLAKAKTVGFRNFFVLNMHRRMPAIVDATASANSCSGFIVPLKTGLNTGIGAWSSIAPVYKKGVVISGYEPMEIMQSVWMLLQQIADNNPATVFQRTKEVSDEVINRSRWMLDEVFEPVDVADKNFGLIKNGGYKIRDKYSAFDAAKILE